MPHYLQRCKKSMFAFLLLLFANFSYSQATFLIKGAVKANNDENLIGVNVVMQNGALGTITDIDGMYELKGSLPAGTYNIVPVVRLK
ncbi:MAG: carboxypeptidase-like regulatory domain-containing protein [Saprospiraceae bacterium]|nr:carboxypeptidase-like regulatory domain-containing protein [Saprospiraceae bacterium]